MNNNELTIVSQAADLAQQSELMNYGASLLSLAGAIACSSHPAYAIGLSVFSLCSHAFISHSEGKKLKREFETATACSRSVEIAEISSSMDRFGRSLIIPTLTHPLNVGLIAAFWLAAMPSMNIIVVPALLMARENFCWRPVNDAFRKILGQQQP
jgi:hypothetical protein